jgi:hypothetical protein
MQSESKKGPLLVGECDLMTLEGGVHTRSRSIALEGTMFTFCLHIPLGSYLLLNAPDCNNSYPTGNSPCG